MIFTEGTILYHGSYVGVENPDLALCRPGKDFGRGFYLTADYAQACRFVSTSIKKAISAGCAPAGHSRGVVSKFIVGSTEELDCFAFHTADAAWLSCVVAHRKEIEADMRQWSVFDVMEGKIANDNTNMVINAYMRGLYGAVGSKRAVETALSFLEPERLKEQVCLRTDRALDAIRYLGSEELCQWM